MTIAARCKSKDRAVAAALLWSKHMDMPAYIYLTAQGWKWAASHTITHTASAVVETVDYAT